MGVEGVIYLLLIMVLEVFFFIILVPEMREVFSGDRVVGDVELVGMPRSVQVSVNNLKDWDPASK